MARMGRRDISVVPFIIYFYDLKDYFCVYAAKCRVCGGTRAPLELSVPGGCEPRHVRWGLDSSSLQNGYKLLTAEASCQPNFCFLTLSLFVILLIYSWKKKNHWRLSRAGHLWHGTEKLTWPKNESKQGMLEPPLPLHLGGRRQRQVDCCV